MIDFELNERGYLKRHESSDLEYKENFHWGDDALRYIKTLVGMANNRGGQIVFGVKNSPLEPVGMTNGKFETLDPADIENLILRHFTPAIEWSMAIETHEGKRFGVLTVMEAEEKPVICVKAKSSILREGAIYYRYRGETREIGYAELNKMMIREKQKSLILWFSNTKKVRVVR